MHTPKIIPAIFKIIIFSLLGCQQNQPTEILPLDRSIKYSPTTSLFELKVGETATTEDKSSTLKFVRVISDSRCPEGAACIWEGRAEIEILVTRSNTESETVILTLSGLTNENPVNGKFYSYRLTKLLPYPKVGQPNNVEDYVAYIQVDPLPQYGQKSLTVESYLTDENGKVHVIFTGNETVTVHSVITNNTDKEITLTKPNGGPFIEYKVLRNGVELYDSFSDKMFIQVITNTVLKQGESITVDSEIPKSVWSGSGEYNIGFNSNFNSPVTPTYSITNLLIGY